MTRETLERAEKLASSVEALDMLTSQSADTLVISYGAIKKTFYGGERIEIVGKLREMMKDRREELESL